MSPVTEGECPSLARSGSMGVAVSAHVIGDQRRVIAQPTSAGTAAAYCECAVATEQELTHGRAIESALAVFDSDLKSADTKANGSVPATDAQA
jgi:hypothetical protein